MATSLLVGSAVGWSLVVGGAALAGLLALVLWWRPDILLRVLAWPLKHTIYPMEVHGACHVPREGPALILSNHVSHIDALLLFAAQRRAVRFVIWAPYTRVPGLRLLLRLARVIPVDSRAGPRALIQSLRAAGEALTRGDVVCIFPEGGITRTGFLQPFHRGFEQILRRTPAPVIPACLDQVWGSIFSFRGGRFFWKWPRRLPYRVTVAFGPPLPPSATAPQARQAVEKLLADCAVARGPKRRPVHREFVRMASRHPFRVCLVDPLQNSKIYRYGEVLTGAHCLACLLQPALAGDRMVGLWLPPSAGGALANIALALMGKVPVNLNYTGSAALVQSAARQCELRHVLTSRRFTAKIPLAAGQGVEPIYLEDFRDQVSRWRRLAVFAAVVILPRMLLERWILGTARHAADELATVIFSSGSTGDPKGVMLAQRNVAANTASVIQGIDPGPKDRILGILPFFHSFGFTVTLWVPLQVGASVVYHADPRQAKEVGELCRKYRCTILLTTPTFLRFCLRRSESGDFDSLRILMCGAEKLPSPLALDFKERLGVIPLEGYGCTELSPVAAANVPDWQGPSEPQVGNKPGTIGRPVPGVAARIVNPDSREDLPVGSEGLLLIYGGNVMAGYLGRPEATQEVIRDGWYVTGDIARMDVDGFLTITDRLSRFSKIGGEMVPHQRIEDEIHALLHTAERAVAVTAVADLRRGERLIVLHTPLDGWDVHRLWQELNARGLPNLWVPGERDFFEVAELPVLGTGKIDLKRIKEMAAERAGE